MHQVEQYVMAYRGNHDEIKKLLPDGYTSLRPVLRLNVEMIDAGSEQESVRIEFNTPVAGAGKRGWLNLTVWNNETTDVKVSKSDKSTEFTAGGFLNIRFTRVGVEGGCPKEDDNDGTFFFDRTKGRTEFIAAEIIDEKKEYCDCTFAWNSPESIIADERDALVKEAMAIKTEEVLGAYVVGFERE